MALKKYNISRTVVFPTLAAAMASKRVFGLWEIAVIKGDNSRFKRGDGIKYSGDGVLPFVGSTFSQLPWYNAQASFATAYAAPATATLTAAQLATKYIKTLSAAATTLTLPLATALATQLSATQGTELNFLVDNTAGANTVTIAVNTGIVVGAGALTGNTTLTIAAGQIGTFKIFFKSNAAALLYRTL